MVAEPTNESAPIAPCRRSLPCRMVVLAFLLMTIGVQVEPQDNILDEQEYTYIDREEEMTVDLVKKEDWCLKPGLGMSPWWKKMFGWEPHRCVRAGIRTGLEPVTA